MSAIVEFGFNAQAVERGLANMERRINGFGAQVKNMMPNVAGVLGAIGAGAVAREVTDAVVKMERLEKMLTATAGSAAGARARLAELRDVARLPGVDFEQAVQGDVRLRAVGLSADLSKEAITQFGNALALVGGSAADLDGVFLALSQIAAKGNVFAEEINQIAERVPQVRAVMKDVFGTADTEALQAMGMTAEEFITRLTEGFGQLTRASRGLQDDFSELSTLWMEVANDVGAPVVKTLVPAFTDLATVIASNKEMFVTFGTGAGEALRIAIGGVNTLQDAFNALGQAMNSDDSFTVAFARNQRLRDQPPTAAAAGTPAAGGESSSTAADAVTPPVVKKATEQEKAAARMKTIQDNLLKLELERLPPAERLERLMEIQRQKIEEMRNQGGLFFDATVEGMKKFAQAQVDKGSSGVEKTLERLQEIMRLQQEMEGLQAGLRDSAADTSKEAAEAAAAKEKEETKAREKALEEAITAEKERQQKLEASRDLALEMAILQAKAKGQGDVAKQLEREQAIRQRMQSIMSRTGMGEEEARIAATRMQALQEQADAREGQDSGGQDAGRYDADGRRADGRKRIMGYSRARQGGAEEARGRALAGLAETWPGMYAGKGGGADNPLAGKAEANSASPATNNANSTQQVAQVVLQVLPQILEALK